LQAARSARLSGSYVVADELYTAAIRDLETAGPSDLRLARSLLELGGVREVQGRCQQAADLVRRGIRILEAAEPPNPFDTSEAWQALGKAYDCEHLYSKAEPAMQRAFDLEQSAAAPRPDRLVEILASQGVVYESEHRFAEAETVFERAQSILVKNPRVSPMEAALLLNNLGLLYRMMGRNAESKSTFLQGLALADAADAPDAGAQVSLLYNLASLDLAGKQYRDAAVRFERILRLLDRGAPLPPRSAGQMLQDYSACLRKLGNGSQAKAMQTRASALLVSQPDGNGRMMVDATEFARNK
jgi:hypothetical protein